MLEFLSLWKEVVEIYSSEDVIVGTYLPETYLAIARQPGKLEVLFVSNVLLGISVSIRSPLFS